MNHKAQNTAFSNSSNKKQPNVVRMNEFTEIDTSYVTLYC